MMNCVRSERRRSLMKYAINGSSVMVALFAIYQLRPSLEGSKLTSQDLFGFLNISILIGRYQIGHSNNLRVVLVPTY